jgi:membrane protein DedA with SNARE-associated domain/membrane-associated phospholipid phosphatase
MLDYLIHFVSRFGEWGYLVVFLGATLESAIFLGFVIPGETLALIAGFFAAQGLLELEIVIFCTALGATVGDSIGYEIGQRFGRPALTRYGGRFGLSSKRVNKADAFFARHGSKAVFLGRFISFGRAMVPFLAGSSKMPYHQFLLYNVFGAIVWSSAVVALGYAAGESWHFVLRWLGRVSQILWGLSLFLLLLAWLYRWAIRHETHIKQRWNNFVQRPGILRISQRFAPQITFLQARLSPGSYLGLNLTLGAIVLLGASRIFGGIAEDVVTGEPLTAVDAQVADWFHSRATPIIIQVMLVISQLNGPSAITTYTVLAGWYLGVKRDWYWLTCLLVTIPTGMLLNVLMKYAFHRARPSFEHPILTIATYSFPSGHAAGSTLFYGTLAAILVAKIHRWQTRVNIVLIAIMIVLLVSFSRIYLGVHYLSDVLAGMVEGVAWLSLCLTGIHTYWQRRVARRTGI